MNYFEFYNIPVSFKVDEATIKRIFYANSKKYHPDFYTLESEEKQAEILDLSTLNNQAYKTLSDFDKRMKYILEWKDILGAEGENKLPQSFLMEMMDINEVLMELEFDFEQKAFQKVENDISQLNNDLYNEIGPFMESYDGSDSTNLTKIKEYYLKKRYLLRIKENLNKFAPQ